MNIWQCNQCDEKVIGHGGAIGLRVIGWYFSKGMPSKILCPKHHPGGHTGSRIQADELQNVIAEYRNLF